MKMRLSSTMVMIAFIIIIIGSGCSKSGGYNSPSPTPPAPTPTVKQVTLQSNTTLGSYLVDKDGRTLYFFSVDADGTNHCGGACAPIWPVFNVDNLSADQLGTGLTSTDFGQITTASGKQVTYKGWPLYYYAPPSNGTNTPEAAGQTNGENVDGIWFVGKPDYSIMIVKAQLVGQDGKSYKPDFTEGTGADIYFTDGSGHTLYTFTADALNKNNFTAADFSNNSIFPIYETESVVVPSSLDKTQFGSITVFGRKQLTYRGWPLYYFGQDGTVRGSNKGISFPHPGIWPVATATTVQAH